MHLISRVAGFIWFRILRYRRTIIRENLINAFPEKSIEGIKSIEKEYFGNFARVFLEFAMSYSFKKEDWARHVHLENPEEAVGYLEKGLPIIMLEGHTSNWEWPAFAVGQLLGYPFDFLYKPVESAFFNKIMLNLRKEHDGLAIPKDDAIRQIIKRRNIIRIIGIIGDQHPSMGTDKVWTQFLGRQTAFYSGAEKLAVRMGYPVFYVECRYNGDSKYTLRFDEISKPPYQKGETGIIKSYAQRLDITIRENPSDYLWSHRRWKYTKVEEEEHLATL